MIDHLVIMVTHKFENNSYKKCNLLVLVTIMKCSKQVNIATTYDIKEGMGTNFTIFIAENKCRVHIELKVTKQQMFASEIISGGLK